MPARRLSGVFTAAVVAADPEADVPWLATAYVPAPSLSHLMRTCAAPLDLLEECLIARCGGRDHTPIPLQPSDV